MPLGSYYDAGKFKKKANIGNKIKSHLTQYRGYQISATICRADNLQFDIINCFLCYREAIVDPFFV